MEFVYSAIAFVLGLIGAYLLLRPRIVSSQEGLRLKEQELNAAQAELSKVREELAAAKVRAEASAKLEQQIAQRDEQLQALREELHQYDSKRAALEAEFAAREQSLREQLENFEKVREQLKNEFAQLSQEALKLNKQLFLDAAEENLKKREQAVSELVKPIQESLKRLDEQNQKIEEKRTEAYASLTEQVKSLAESQNRLQSETGKLVQALRAPQQRGRWGEIQLKRVVEMAGMQEHCDFTQQESSITDTGKLRPDLIVNLPNGRRIAVDSKAVLDAYLSAFEAQDEDQKIVYLKQHAKQVRDKIVSLSNKAYWDAIGSVEFVVLFLPGEPFFSAALEHDPTLIEFGNQNGVLIATPTTLIALLKAVAYGWRQEKLAENAKQISDLGKELYKRIASMAGSFEKLGRSLDGTVKNYNEAVGVLETRVLPQTRRFKELSAATGDDIPVVQELDRTCRELRAPELTASADSNALPGLGD